MAEPSALRISEATSLALHTVALLASLPQGTTRTTTPDAQRLSAHEIAERIHVSEAHLSKVLQRLHKAHIVDSVRGRDGGFTLAKRASRIRLLDVYEAIEGKLGHSRCLMGKSRCGASRCILGGLLADVDQRLWAYLSNTRVSDLRDTYGGSDAKS